MKKLILLTITALTINVVSASTLTELKNTADSTLKSIDTSSVTNKIYNDVKSGIVGLASGLKVGAEHVYMVLVKQQVVNSIIYCVFFLLGLILIANFINRYKSDEKWVTASREDPSFLGVIRGAQVIVGSVLFIVGLFNIDIMITGVVNPEYGAIKEILTFIK